MVTVPLSILLVELPSRPPVLLVGLKQFLAESRELITLVILFSRCMCGRISGVVVASILCLWLARVL